MDNDSELVEERETVGPRRLAQHLAARSNSRLLVNSSALTANRRQRAACSFKNELSIASPTQLTF